MPILLRDCKREGVFRVTGKFADTDLQALLIEDSAQTLKQLTEALNVAQFSISKCLLHALGKI